MSSCQSAIDTGGEVQDTYPLTPLQEGMLFHSLLSDRETYVISVLMELRSPEQRGALIAALQSVIARHDVLRSAVLWEQMTQPMQVVYREATLPVMECSVDGCLSSAQEIMKHMASVSRMDLRRAPLMRLVVSDDCSGGVQYALLQVHHVVCDYQSLRVLLEETFAFLARREHELQAPVPYRDYVDTVSSAEHVPAAEMFFRQELSDVYEPVAPFGVLTVAGGDRGEEAHLLLDLELSSRLRAQARREGVSAARLVHAAWGLVVGRTTESDDVVYGTTLFDAAARRLSDRGMLGMAVNTLPLRLRLGDNTVRELVEQTRKKLAQLLEHVKTPLVLAQRCGGVRSGSPLFTSMLVFRRRFWEPDAQHGNLTSTRVLLTDYGWTNYPVAITVDDLGDAFSISAQTSGGIDPSRVTSYLQTAIASLVNALECAPQTAAVALQVIPENERHRLVDVLGSNRVPYSEDELVHELFEQQVERSPGWTALVCEEGSLTYLELNRTADRLARQLANAGVGPDRLVGLYTEPGIEMIVGMLGILKAGGAYVPLDPDAPVSRLDYMLRDAAPVALLTQERLRPKIPSFASPIIVLDATAGMAHAHDVRVAAPRSGLSSRNLAYVIYTSGSTGVPKGVMIEHGAIVNLWRGHRQWLGSSAVERVALNASMSFDASVPQFLQLLLGRTIFIVPKRVRLDASLLVSFVEGHGIDAIDCTPSELRSWIAAGLLARARHPLRRVIVGGEALGADLWSTLAACSHTQFYNAYGPTECTVDVSVAPVHGNDGAHIGRPMENRRVYLVDRYRRLVPMGMPGEMYVGGVGLARGYLHQPTLTAQCFGPDPFSDDPQARMYKTGDVARWRGDGTLEFLGRADDQVKIRGYRIELGEVEAQLRKSQQIRDVAIVAREEGGPGEKRLVAYVTLQHEEPISIDELRSTLKAALPEYMVPSAFVVLERLPFTAAGKVDRQALPIPERGAYVNRQYEKPLTEAEKILAGVWRALFSVQQIGRHDNFFELGGHSLLVIQVMERLRRVGLTADVRSIYTMPTLADLARTLVRESDGDHAVPTNKIPADCKVIAPEMLTLIELDESHIARIVKATPGGAENIQDIYPLTPLQEGLLFHNLLDHSRGDVYVLPVLLSLSSRQRLQELINALQFVIDRHDVLRTSVLWEGLPQPLQVVQRRAALPVEELVPNDHREPIDELKDRMNPGRQRLDLSVAPAIRLHVAPDRASQQWYALLQLHHISGDSSLAILSCEAVAHLTGRAAGLPPAVPYRKHVAQALANIRAHDGEAFFRRKLAGVDGSTSPFGLRDVHGDGGDIVEARGSMEAILARGVRGHASALGVSVTTLFHAVWALVVAQTSARSDVVFGSVLLGRFRGHGAGPSALGMFINTLPLRIPIHDASVTQLIELTNRELAELLEYEQTPLVVAQRCSALPDNAPLFSAVLNCRHSVPNPDADWSCATGIKVLAEQFRTNYPVTLSVDDLGDGFSLTAQTDARVDPQLLIEMFETGLRSVVKALEEGAQAPALSLSLLPARERHRVVRLFNTAPAGPSQHQLIHEIFAERVRRSPEAVALEYVGRSMTYSALNAKAEQLANQLVAMGGGPEKLVGICLERGFEMIIAVLGIWKSGCAYVPLDPNYPAHRLAFMLQDSAPTILITQQKLRHVLPATSAKVVQLDADGSGGSGDISNALPGLHPRNLAYVIYTSGSTGTPKGVMVEHAALANLARAQMEVCRAQPGDRVLQFASLSFDASLWELAMALCGGACLCLTPSEGLLPGEVLLRTLRDQRISHAVLPPVALAALPSRDGLALTTIIAGGEQCLPATVRKWAAGRRFINAYGPTETTVCICLHLCESQSASSVPIGRPIANTLTFILNRYGEPVPVGVAGEICAAGASVARGYLNRPGLTAERFAADRFGTDGTSRLYSTGDNGRWQANGAIEYLGRNDSQVKIRGCRVELGEIQAQIMLHPGVDDAVVLAQEESAGEKRVVAYVVGKQGSTPEWDWAASAEMFRKRMLEDWESLYDATYEVGDDWSGPSFVGWNSSLTGATIPESEMNEWLDAAVARIRALRPQRVLEIGCGVGLILQHVAPQCVAYVGTDISRSAVDLLTQWTAGRDDLRHVELQHRSALNLSDLQPASFDTIVLNSVVQYFPDVEYLLAVVERLLPLLTPGGALFIGDVRNLRLLRTFHCEVQLSKAASTVKLGELKRKIAQAMSHEKELLLDPEFFPALSRRMPGICSVDVQLKRGRACNELTRYRYDVVLRKGQCVSPTNDCEFIDWEAAGRSMATFEARVAEGRRDALVLISVPNCRIARALAAERLIDASDERLEVGLLRRQLDELKVTEVDPEALWGLAEKHGYNACIRWGGQGALDTVQVDLLDGTHASPTPLSSAQSANLDMPWRSYTNDLLEGQARRQLIPELRKHLQRRLPKYMIPSAWVSVWQLPMTPNGKVDRRALPVPPVRPEGVDEYVAPRTEVERRLTALWADVLGVDRVGLQDNFFELGGHSLIAARLIGRVAESFAVSMQVQALFKSPTVHQMAELIETRLRLIEQLPSSQPLDCHEGT